MQLHQDRCATSAKLRREWERRLEDNAAAVAALTKTACWWEHVDGPNVELLRDPTPVILAEAQHCSAALSRMVEEHKPQDGAETLVDEIVSVSIAQRKWLLEAGVPQEKVAGVVIIDGASLRHRGPSGKGKRLVESLAEGADGYLCIGVALLHEKS